MTYIKFNTDFMNIFRFTRNLDIFKQGTGIVASGIVTHWWFDLGDVYKHLPIILLCYTIDHFRCSIFFFREQ